MSATHEANGVSSQEIRDAARRYRTRGWVPVPVRYRGKSPDIGGPGWNTVTFEKWDVDRLFPKSEKRNIGLLWGAPSATAAGSPVDVDLDVPEAITAADHMLPPTGSVFGRPSARRSHRVYLVADPPERAATTFEDVDGTMLVELRSTGSQTVVCPSVHESGELITWDADGDPAEVPADDLVAAVGRVAAVAILARHWPTKGSRDKAANALTGGLSRAGWDTDQIETFVRAVAVAAGDDELRKRTDKKADRTKAKIEDGKPATGWPTLAQLLINDGDEVVTRVRDWLGIRDPKVTVTFGDGPTPSAPAWPDPPGPEAFHGLAGDIVRAIEPASEADPAAVLVQALVFFGNRVGRGPHFTAEADRHGCNEFVVLVGQSGKARKGSSKGQVHALFRTAEPAPDRGDDDILGPPPSWVEDRIQSGLSSGEGLIHAVRDPVETQEKVKERGEAPRYETVVADPGVADKRLLVYEPEFANVLKQTERQGNTLSVAVRQAWETGKLGTLTKNSPTKATDAHISIVGHITAEELGRYLTTTEAANGFANRFTWFAVRRSKLLPFGGTPDPAVTAALAARLGDTVRFAETVGEVGLDADARAIWVEVYGELSAGRPGLAGQLLGRAEAHVRRFAMLYALLDKSVVVRAEHLLAALALWDYAERSVLYVFGDALGDPLADDLLKLIRAASGRGVTKTDVSNYLGRNVPADRVNRALGLLLTHGLAHPRAEKTDGRPTERWFAGKPPAGG